MFAAESRGELPKGTAKRWARETPDIKKLPEKVDKTANLARHFPKTRAHLRRLEARLLARLEDKLVAGLEEMGKDLATRPKRELELMSRIMRGSTKMSAASTETPSSPRGYLPKALAWRGALGGGVTGGASPFLNSMAEYVTKNPAASRNLKDMLRYAGKNRPDVPALLGRHIGGGAAGGAIAGALTGLYVQRLLMKRKAKTTS